MTNPMERCGAHSRTTGKPCQKHPVPGKNRCRNHGGLSPGRPVTSGLYTREAKANRAKLRGLIRELNELSAAMRTKPSS